MSAGRAPPCRLTGWGYRRLRGGSTVTITFRETSWLPRRTRIWTVTLRRLARLSDANALRVSVSFTREVALGFSRIDRFAAPFAVAVSEHALRPAPHDTIAFGTVKARLRSARAFPRARAEIFGFAS